MVCLLWKYARQILGLLSRKIVALVNQTNSDSTCVAKPHDFAATC